MIASALHESRFGAQMHERRRGAPGPQGHELGALHAAHESRPAASLNRAGHSLAAEHSTSRHSQLAEHTRVAIHARHLARVQYERELVRYRVEVRQWHHLLTEHERLLRKLASLEKRLARLTLKSAT